MIPYSLILKKYKPFIDMFSGNNPLILLDERYRCLYSSDGMFDVGKSISGNIRQFPEPVTSVTEASVYNDGTFYCMRLYPIKDNESSETVYIGEIILPENICNMLGCADIAAKVLPLYNAVEKKVSEILKHLADVHSFLIKSQNFDLTSDLTSAEKAIYYISTVCVNAYEYINMRGSDQNKTLIDVGNLCESCMRKCNHALAKCGRRVDCVITPEELYVYADCHKAVVAVVNAVQNAMLYSPRDTVPLFSVYPLKKEQKNYVEICVKNENSMFARSDFREEVDFNFNYQRLGYGIPIIKAFVKTCGGYFSMEEKDEQTIVKITLPCGNAHPGVVVFRAATDKEYKTGMPSFIDTMMAEVIVFFGTN